MRWPHPVPLFLPQATSPSPLRQPSPLSPAAFPACLALPGPPGLPQEPCPPTLLPSLKDHPPHHWMVLSLPNPLLQERPPAATHIPSSLGPARAQQTRVLTWAHARVSLPVPGRPLPRGPRPPAQPATFSPYPATRKALISSSGPVGSFIPDLTVTLAARAPAHWQGTSCSPCSSSSWLVPECSPGPSTTACTPPSGSLPCPSLHPDHSPCP